MISNLIENAIRYTPCGGAITVRVTAPTGTDRATLAIVDTGPGVPVDDRERKSSSRSTGAPTSSVPGSGLGLAIVRIDRELRMAAEHYDGGWARRRGPAGGRPVCAEAPPAVAFASP